MRTLKLETPRMVGTDVADWQRFLAGKGFYSGPINGTFDPATAQASKDYQSSVGLSADGVVGPITYVRAVHDGLQSSTRPLSAGMDTNVAVTRFSACMVSEGMKFVARYYSMSAGKAMKKAEATALSAAGLQLAVVYQDRQNQIADFDAAQGKASAKRALAQADALGQPGGSAIYFSADFDPTSAEIRGPIMQYFQAVHDEFSAASTQYAIGIYGSGLTCRLLRDASLVQFAWLAGSTGFRESTQFRPRAHILQVLPSRTICKEKLSIDDDVAQTADFGGFQVS